MRACRAARASSGFSLMELLVVVLIMGVLAFMSIPQYQKTIETGKANTAQGLVNMVGKAHQMYALDNNDAYLAGSVALSGTHTLATSRYVAAADWAGEDYDYYSCGSNSGTCCSDSVISCTGCTAVACAKRKTGAAAAYATWGYKVCRDGRVCATDATAPPPI